MTKVADLYRQHPERLLFLCDFTPPRGADFDLLERARPLEADFICVGYTPGKTVRVDSATTAYLIRERTGKEVVFNLGCRDMNRLALQSYLLGASALGLENLVVIQGDALNEREQCLFKTVNDFTPTELIASIKALNEGTDMRGSSLRAPTSFCIGAAIDLGRPLEQEARLTHRKAQAGADFFITQTVFDVAPAQRFLETYQEVTGEALSTPVFYGLPVLDQEGLVLGEVPEGMSRDLEKGRPGAEIALELLEGFVQAGLRAIYLVPPIMRGGRRGYEAAQEVLEQARRLG